MSHNSGQSTENTGASTGARASAQSTNQSSQATTQNLVAITIAVTSTATLLATTAGIGFAFWAVTTKPQLEKNATPAAAHAFFRSSSRQLELDLAIGAGPSIEDLASIAEIPRDHLPRFGTLLRHHRSELLELVHEDRVTDATAMRALERMGELARHDAVLRTDYQAFLERHEVTGALE